MSDPVTTQATGGGSPIPPDPGAVAFVTVLDRVLSLSEIEKLLSPAERDAIEALLIRESLYVANHIAGLWSPPILPNFAPTHWSLRL